jgi:hypothetical protein
MIVNSLGDWVVYGLGLVGLFYGATRLLPDMAVSCILVLYRAYRKLQIGLEQAKRDLPLAEDNERKATLGKEAVVELMPVERESWA